MGGFGGVRLAEAVPESSRELSCLALTTFITHGRKDRDQLLRAKSPRFEDAKET